jgi:hypothetical protein
MTAISFISCRYPKDNSSLVYFYNTIINSFKKLLFLVFDTLEFLPQYGKNDDSRLSYDPAIWVLIIQIFRKVLPIISGGK